MMKTMAMMKTIAMKGLMLDSDDGDDGDDSVTFCGRLVWPRF